MAHEIGHCRDFQTRMDGVRMLFRTPPHLLILLALMLLSNTTFCLALQLIPKPLNRWWPRNRIAWDDATFGNELMTGILDFTSDPLSVITVGAFHDMGYGVDYNAAQQYSPPATTVTTIGAGISNAIGSGISNAVVTVIDNYITSNTTAGGFPTSTSTTSRITFPNKPAMILSEDDASRQMVRSGY